VVGVGIGLRDGSVGCMSAAVAGRGAADGFACGGGHCGINTGPGLVVNEVRSVWGRVDLEVIWC
jgi:hypothetical protein